MQGLLRLFRARFSRCAVQRQERKAKSVNPAALGKATEPGVTILSYDSFR